VKDGPEMSLNNVIVRKGSFALHAEGRIGPGVHLITGVIGAGKTTLGELIAGIIRQERGNLVWTGNNRVMLMQDAGFHISTTTVFKEAESWKVDPDKVISSAGLFEKRNSDLLQLSRGELRRLVLTAILARNDDLVVLDEPFAGLDDKAGKWVSRQISMRTEKITVIISHSITMLPDVDRIWEMRDGKLYDLGIMPIPLTKWVRAPMLIRYLNKAGHPPSGLSRTLLEEAACRTRESD